MRGFFYDLFFFFFGFSSFHFDNALVSVSNSVGRSCTKVGELTEIDRKRFP